MDDKQYDPEAAYTQSRDKLPELPEWHSLSHSLRMAFMEVYLYGAKHGISKMEKVALDKPKHDTPLREALSIISSFPTSDPDSPRNG